MESVLENDYTTVHKVYTSFSVSLGWKVSISLTAWQSSPSTADPSIVSTLPRTINHLGHVGWYSQRKSCENLLYFSRHCIMHFNDIFSERGVRNRITIETSGYNILEKINKIQRNSWQFQFKRGKTTFFLYFMPYGYLRISHQVVRNEHTPQSTFYGTFTEYSRNIFNIVIFINSVQLPPNYYC